MAKQREPEVESPGVTIEARVLSGVMRAAAAVVEARNTIPILANVLISTRGDGAIDLVTTNLDIEYRQTIATAEAGALATTVDARRLAALAGVVDQGGQIALKPVDGRLEVRAGRARWLLPTLPGDNFPILVPGDLAWEITMPGRDLASALARVAHSISTEQTRYYLNGVFLDAEAGRARVVSTNGHAMSVAGLGAAGGVEWPAGAEPVIVPQMMARRLVALCGDMDGPVTLGWNRAMARVVAPGWTLTGKLIDGTYPEYRRVSPGRVDEPVRFDPELLGQALRRVQQISTEKTRAVRIERGEGRLVVSLTSPEHGAASDEVPAECPRGAELVINAAYLGDCLDSLGGDSVELHQEGPGAPVLLRRVVDDGARCVVMPMRG